MAWALQTHHLPRPAAGSPSRSWRLPCRRAQPRKTEGGPSAIRRGCRDERPAAPHSPRGFVLPPSALRRAGRTRVATRSVVHQGVWLSWLSRCISCLSITCCEPGRASHTNFRRSTAWAWPKAGGDRRHRVAEEAKVFGWGRATIRFGAQPQCVASVAGLLKDRWARATPVARLIMLIRTAGVPPAVHSR
jgi:hypothetical protein